MEFLTSAQLQTDSKNHGDKHRNEEETVVLDVTKGPRKRLHRGHEKKIGNSR